MTTSRRFGERRRIVRELADGRSGQVVAAAGLWHLRVDRALDEVCALLAGPTLAAEWEAPDVEPAQVPCQP